jgi:hypothetical protein
MSFTKVLCWLLYQILFLFLVSVFLAKTRPFPGFLAGELVPIDVKLLLFS